MKVPLIGQESRFNLTKEVWYYQNEYVDDFRIVINQREMVRIPFACHSPQINHRKSIVDYLKKISGAKRLSQTCLHLAVYLLDVFMDNHNILAERLLLVANACLLLAAKYEETNTNIPRIKELNLAINASYTIKDYTIVEQLILNFFNWYLNLPTAAHYIHYFMHSMLNIEDLCQTNESSRTLFYDADEYIRMYLDRVLDDVNFMHKYKPSVLAAAIISAARKMVGLQCWTKQLENLTRLSKLDISDAVQALQK